MKPLEDIRTIELMSSENARLREELWEKEIGKEFLEAKVFFFETLMNQVREFEEKEKLQRWAIESLMPVDEKYESYVLESVCHYAADMFDFRLWEWDEYRKSMLADVECPF